MRLVAVALTALVAAGCPSGPSYSGRVTYDFVPSVYDPIAQAGTLDFAHAVQKPVRNAVVQIMQGTTILKAGTTDADGRYAIELSSSPSGRQAVVVLAKSADPVIQVEDNTSGDAVWSIGMSVHGPGTYDLHATSGWTGSGYDLAARQAAPFAILDSMYTAAQAFMAVRTVAFPELRVNWSPNNAPSTAENLATGDIVTSHFSPADGQIYVLGKDGVDTDEFDSHVIVHEWGHFVEFNLSRSDSPGGGHSPGQLLDPRLALSEGYGDAIPAMTLGSPIYSDTLWSGGNLVGFGFDAESEPTPTDDPNPGPFSEMSVMRLLYHLWNSGDPQPYDRVSLGLGPLYDTLVGPEKNANALTTIGSFIAGLKAQPGVNATDVDTLLAHYSIGPIATEWGDGDASLRAMYTDAPPSYGASVELVGGTNGADSNYNMKGENRYYVVTGNGSRITTSATSVGDVGLWVYQRGAVVASADQQAGGSTPVTETTSFASQAGATYVISLVGFNRASGPYSVSVNFTSP